LGIFSDTLPRALIGKGRRINLPPHKDIVGILTLTKCEMDIVNERAEATNARYVVSGSWYSVLTFFSVISANESGKVLTRV
jgi:hypothetical protein